MLVTRCRFVLFGESLDNNKCSRIGERNAIGESSLVIMTSLALLDQFDKKHFSFRLTQARRRVTLLTPRAQRNHITHNCKIITNTTTDSTISIQSHTTSLSAMDSPKSSEKSAQNESTEPQSGKNSLFS